MDSQPTHSPLVLWCSLPLILMATYANETDKAVDVSGGMIPSLADLDIADLKKVADAIKRLQMKDTKGVDTVPASKGHFKNG